MPKSSILRDILDEIIPWASALFPMYWGQLEGWDNEDWYTSYYSTKRGVILTVYKHKAAEDGWGGFILIVIHLLFSVSASLNQDFWYLDLEFCLWLDKHILALFSR